MADLTLYKCSKCGYSVYTEPQGHYALLSGRHYNFSCNHCKEIVSVSAHSLSTQGFTIYCPNCDTDGSLSTWNPVDGHCPRCKGKMEVSDDLVILAD